MLSPPHARQQWQSKRLCRAVCVAACRLMHGALPAISTVSACALASFMRREAGKATAQCQRLRRQLQVA